jgi:hypothetical protein
MFDTEQGLGGGRSELGARKSAFRGYAGLANAFSDAFYLVMESSR